MPKLAPSLARRTLAGPIASTVVSKCARMLPSLTRFSMSGFSHYFTLAPQAGFLTAIVTRAPVRGGGGGLPAGRRGPGGDKGEAADLEELRGREENGERRPADERVAEATPLDEDARQALARGLDGAGDPHRSGADDEEVVCHVP